MPDFKIFTGTSNPAFANSVASSLKVPLGNREIFRFADGEIFVRIQEKCEGASTSLLFKALVIRLIKIIWSCFLCWML